jgi:hypothetical protein
METGLRALAGILFLASAVALILVLRQLTQQGGVSVEGIVILVAWALSPALTGWLVVKLAKALEWLADIKRKVGA